MNKHAIEVGKMEKQSSECSRERGRSRDTTTGTGVRESCGGQGTMQLPCRANTVACSNLELGQTQHPNTPMETIWVFMVHVARKGMLIFFTSAAAQGYDSVCGLCCSRGPC